MQRLAVAAHPVLGHDLEEGKLTLPLIHALRHCSPDERDRIGEVIVKESLEDEDFDDVFAIVHTYGGIDYTVRRAGDYVATAKQCLTAFPPSQAKDALFGLADYVVNRER